MLELVQLLATTQVDVGSIVGMIERGDLVKLDAIYTARPELLDDLSRLAKSDNFLSALDCLVHHAGDISDGSVNGLLGAAAAASVIPSFSDFSRFAGEAVSGLECSLGPWAAQPVTGH